MEHKSNRPTSSYAKLREAGCSLGHSILKGSATLAWSPDEPLVKIESEADHVRQSHDEDAAPPAE